MQHIKTNFDKIILVLKDISGHEITKEVITKNKKKNRNCFSQPCDQCMMQKNYTKSFSGFKSIVLVKVMGFTTLQFLNKFIYNKPIRRVKHVLAN